MTQDCFSREEVTDELVNIDADGECPSKPDEGNTKPRAHPGCRCYGRAQVQQVWWVQSNPIWDPVDKYTVGVVKASAKLLTNTLKKTPSAFGLPD